MIVLGTDLLLTHPRATTDAVVQAGPVLMQRPRTLPQGEHPLDQKQGAPKQTHVNVRTVKAVQWAAETPATGDEDSGVSLTPGDAEVGIFLVVLQQHVEVRLMVLDQVGFQRKGLGLAVGDDEFDLAHLASHQPDARRQIVTTAEVTAHPAAQGLGFADVEDSVLSIAHQVTTGFGRNVLQPTLQPFGLSEQRCGRDRILQDPISLRSSSLCWPWSERLHPPGVGPFSPHRQTRCDHRV